MNGTLKETQNDLKRTKQIEIATGVLQLLYSTLLFLAVGPKKRSTVSSSLSSDVTFVPFVDGFGRFVFSGI